MILLLDQGNTRLKWGLWAHDRWLVTGAEPDNSGVGLVARLNDLPDLPGTPDWIGLCSVAADPAVEALHAELAPLGAPLHCLKPKARAHGVENRYQLPEQLGADRFAALIAAWRAGKAPCVVVNAGTAVTIDALDGAGVFLGGMILPGLETMRAGLASRTARVAITPGAPGSFAEFPQCTADAVETGLLSAVVGSIEAMRRRLASRTQAVPGVLLSGGDAECLRPWLAEPVELNQLLVLEGVRWVARDLNVPGS